METKLKYSFLMVNYNMGKMVSRCVENFKSQVAETDSYEVLIADNSNDPECQIADVCLNSHSNVRILRLDQNRGWVDALNRLLPLATGEFILIAHPDIEMTGKCLSLLARFIESNPSAGVVSPDLWYPNGQRCTIRTCFPSVMSELRRLGNTVARAIVKRNIFRGEKVWDRTADAHVQMVMSVCMLIRREVLQQISQINPKLSVYYANDFICAKAAALGWNSYYVRDARAIHFERFAPRRLYGAGREMDYKSDPLPANARMRTDFFTFLGSIYPWHTVAAIRLIAICEDFWLLITNSLHFFPRRAASVRHLMRSLIVDLGGKAR
jgi:GT2 family glycosyltransferase